MASKGVEFDRNIRLSWLDDAAMLAAQGLDQEAARVRLQELLEDEIPSAENRRKTIIVLGRIWNRSAVGHPHRSAEALRLLEHIELGDRVWLHYGMTLLTHPFFRAAAGEIGLLGRQHDALDREKLRKRLAGELGELGTLPAAVNRVVFSLLDWGLLSPVDDSRKQWRPREGTLRTDHETLQLWLLASTLEASPKDELLLADLLRLPELFPFHFTIGLAQIRDSPMFDIHRQGGGWDMVRLSSNTAAAPVGDGCARAVQANEQFSSVRLLAGRKPG